MKVDARNYGKIVILSINGPVTQADLISLAVEVPESCANAAHVILVLAPPAPLDAQAAKHLLAWRDKQATLRPKLVVAADLAGADAKDLVQALDVIDTTEADRLLQVFARDHELARLREKKASTDKQVEQLLALPAKHTQADFEAAAQKLRMRNRTVKSLLHVFSGTKSTAGHFIEVVTDADSRIQELQNRALALLKKE